MGEPKN